MTQSLLDFLVADSKPLRVLDLLAHGKKPIPVAATEKFVGVLSCRDAHHLERYPALLMCNGINAILPPRIEC